MKPFDTSGAFIPAIPGGDGLRRMGVRGVGVTLLSGGVGLAIQIVATAVLARLLAPRDFGLVAMVTTFSLLLVNFGLNGLTEAVVQKEEIDHSLASALFWINLSGGSLLTLLFAASGSLLARFYHDPHIKSVTIGISATILATSVSVLHLALLKRAMLFWELSVNDICARGVSMAVSIYLGWVGWGYWALIGGAIALPLSTTVGAWYLCRWMPGRPQRLAGTTSVLRFAIHTYGRFGVNYVARNTDNLLVGWRFSAQSLGFYKKAYDLFALSAGQFVGSISVVVVATLSRVNRDATQYRRYLLGMLAVAAFVGMGLAADLTLIGKDLIRLLLGPGWEESGRIFTFFGPGIGIMVLYQTHGWIHLSIGRPDRWFRWGIIEFVITCLLFVAGLPWGPVGIAVAWTTSFWLLVVPAMWYAGRPIDFGVSSILAVVWKYILAALLSGAATGFITQRVSSLVAPPGALGALLRIIACSLLLGTFYLVAVVLLHGGFAPLYQMAGLLREMVSRRESDSPSFASQAGGADHDAKVVPREPVPGFSSGKGPLVSILIPAYNSQEWIADTLRSALAQTWEPKEIIVVDDGSTDKTFEIAKRFESEGIRIFRQENLGASAARNKAFALSHGAYIQWLDADDLLAPDKIARQMEVLEQCDSKRILLSSSWGQFMYRPSRAQFIPTGLWSDLSPVEWLLCKMGQNVYMQTATWLVSRELAEAAGAWDTTLWVDDDGEYFCRVLLAAEGVRFVSEAKVYYRLSGVASLSYIGQSDRKIRAQWRSMQMHIGHLRSLEDSARVREACVAYLQTSLIYFYPERLDIVQEAQQLASELGGQLEIPRLSWKYSWIEAAFGYGTAKRARLQLPQIKRSLMRLWDKTLSQS